MKHTARVVFSVDVWKQIEWFTNNLSTEIGALGKVTIKKEDGENYFYIDKLYFPQQEVTGATVKFTPEMWGKLLKDHGLKEMQKIGFYWHRHPGNAAHSGTDDEDTFETFMSKEGNRPYFIFMQTAVTAKGEWDEELRIDIRKPIRTTILNTEITASIEETSEDETLRKTCEKIRDTVIIKPKYPTYTPKKFGGGNSSNGSFSHPTITQKKNSIELDEKNYKIDLGIYNELADAMSAGMFGTINRPKEYDNDILYGHATTPEQKVCLDISNGNVTVLAGKEFQVILKETMDNKGSELYRAMKIKGLKVNPLSEDTTKFCIQPNGGQYKELQTALIKMYIIYCNKLLTDSKVIAHEEQKGDATRESSDLEAMAEDEMEHIIKDTPEIVEIVLADIERLNIISWNDHKKILGVVNDMEGDHLGEISLTSNGASMFITGPKLVRIVKEIEVIMFEQKEEEE